MHDRQLWGLVVLLGMLVAANILIHWLIVCRALYKHGSRFPTGFLFWRVFKEMRAYRELCKARGRPLTTYYVAFILAWFNLLLAFATALRALWEQTHPFE
jgi:hypothetical protein